MHIPLLKELLIMINDKAIVPDTQFLKLTIYLIKNIHIFNCKTQ